MEGPENVMKNNCWEKSQVTLTEINHFLFFKIEPSNLHRMLTFRPWYHICWKILGFGSRFGPLPQKGSKFENFSFSRKNLQIYTRCWYLGPDMKSLKNWIWGTNFRPLPPKGSKLKFFSDRTFKFKQYVDSGGLIYYLFKHFSFGSPL